MSDLLYRYMPSEGCIKSILNRSLRISRVDSLNDPYDMLYGVTGLPKEVNGNQSSHDLVQSTRAHVSDLYGVICFSKRCCIPTMWAHYADAYRGMCLVFDSEAFPQDVLYPVKYEDERVTVSFEELCSGYVSDFSESYFDTFKQSLYTKATSWGYEEESRLVLPVEYMKENEGCFPLEPGMLKRVILGYECDYSLSKLRQLLDSSGFRDVSIHRTYLSQTRYEVQVEEVSN